MIVSNIAACERFSLCCGMYLQYHTYVVTRAVQTRLRDVSSHMIWRIRILNAAPHRFYITTPKQRFNINETYYVIIVLLILTQQIDNKHVGIKIISLEVVSISLFIVCVLLLQQVNKIFIAKKVKYDVLYQGNNRLERSDQESSDTAPETGGCPCQTYRRYKSTR